MWNKEHSTYQGKSRTMTTQGCKWSQLKQKYKTANKEITVNCSRTEEWLNIQQIEGIIEQSTETATEQSIETVMGQSI